MNRQPIPLNLVLPGHKSFLDFTEVVIEKQLEKDNLSKEQIRLKNIEELEQSLNKINDYIDNNDKFLPRTLIPRLRINYLLKERKKFLSERLEALSSEQKIEDLRDLIRQVQNEVTKKKLNDALNNLEDECRELQDKLHENHKSMWRLILAKDTVVTMIFGILGLAIVSACIIGMFLKFQIPEVFSDFLLTVMGYLVAQVNARPSEQNKQQLG